VDGVGRAAVRKAALAAQHAETPFAEFVCLPPEEIARVLPHGFDAVAPLLTRLPKANVTQAARLLDRVDQAGGIVLPFTDDTFPSTIASALGPTAPVLLFVLGDTALLTGSMAAVVGARKATAKGLDLARACASAFGEIGVPIVSGGADGVDAAAHSAVLEVGGRTVLVLPQGLLTFRSGSPLRFAIEEGQATVVSEFRPDLPWERHAAVTRNATISALSELVCVIEPKKQGGSIRTARCAIEQGKRLVVHCGETQQSIATTLSRAGALDVLAEDGTFRAERLVDLWNSRPAPIDRQGTLF
jgi:DNA protecting protein DprA